MIATIKGNILEKEDKALVVDVQGVGFLIVVLKSLWSKVKEGDEINLRIYHHLSEGSEDLYGFLTKEDLNYFKLLLTVPSVGPRTAIGILEVAPPKVLAQAVTEEDTVLLTKVSGVGRKTAERILVELKEKIEATTATGAAGGVQQETVEALVSIGYTVAQARGAVQKLPRGVETVEEAVKQVLRAQSA